MLREELIQVWAAQGGPLGLARQRLPESRRNLLSAFGDAAKVSLKFLLLEHPLALPPAFWPEPQAAGRRFARLAEAHWKTLDYGQKASRRASGSWRASWHTQNPVPLIVS